MKKKEKIWQNSKNQIVTTHELILWKKNTKTNNVTTQKLKLWPKPNCEENKKKLYHKLWQNFKTQIVTTTKLKLWQGSKTHIVTNFKTWIAPKLKNSNCDKNKNLNGDKTELKSWQNSYSNKTLKLTWHSLRLNFAAKQNNTISS